MREPSDEVKTAAADLGATVCEHRKSLVTILEQYARIQETIGQSNRTTNEILLDIEPFLNDFEEALRAQRP